MASLDIAAKVATVLAVLLGMGDCVLKYGQQFLGWVRGPTRDPEPDALEMAELGRGPNVAERLDRLEEENQRLWRSLRSLQEGAPPIPPRSERRKNV
ncbi:hypothetical protein Focb16_v002966 [Fusarium oxysporum f. sp. cubense]|uniref:Uncharacterized protein n=1 Tax=Fusarium oxysporum f. sp. cubense TaxID=61366 RepID=A0A559L4Y2_FUSOC|nr:hypothetical protein Focb16_v002966 [Fusarium oxysporum f. sp. cubense]